MKWAVARIKKSLKRDLKITAYVIVIPQALFRDDCDKARSGHFAEVWKDFIKTSSQLRRVKYVYI